LAYLLAVWRRTLEPMRIRAGWVIVPSLLMAACTAPGATGAPAPSGLYLVVHNRVTVPVEFGYADPVLPCSDATLTAAQLQQPRPGRPDPGIWGHSLAIAAYEGSVGPITIVVSKTGARVSRGPVASADIPPCEGTPPPEVLPEVVPQTTP
jgi:hypothetical protein